MPPLARRVLIACSAVVAVTLPGYGGALVLWPWEPLRVCILLVTLAVVAGARRRRWMILVVCCWAFVASPLVITQDDRGFATRFPNAVPGEQIGQGVPSGPYAMNAGSVPVGLTKLSASPRFCLNGESSDPDSMLVAWTVTALPWPHIDRTRIIGLGGNFIDQWVYPERVVVHRDDHQLLVSGKRTDQAGAELPEVRALVWAPTHSAITVLGWTLLLAAVAARLLARGPFVHDRPPPAPSPLPGD